MIDNLLLKDEYRGKKEELVSKHAVTDHLILDGTSLLLEVVQMCLQIVGQFAFLA